MNRLLASLPLLPLLALAPSATGQTAHAVLHGPQGGIGDAVAYDEATHQTVAAPAELEGIRLLPIDFHGHTRLAALEPGRPRWVGDVPGAGRILLPGGRGGLYRYERPMEGGSARFGFLLVDRRGMLTSIGELPGTGALQDQDPYLRRVGISPDGRWILTGTTPAAGGNALELGLETQEVLDRTAGLPPLTIGDAGLALGADLGWIGTREGMFRFRRLPGARAQRVTFEPQPAWYSGEIVTSTSGLRAITTAGQGPSACTPWTAGPTGPAVEVDDQPRPLSRAGFLPDDFDGPYLAVSDDGLRAAWRREAVASEPTREAFLRGVQAGAPPAVQFTSDAYYTDTFDEVGTLSFLPQSHALIAAVGERWTPVNGGVEGLDLFRVTLDGAGQPVFTNLTQTGSSSAPFLENSSIDPEGHLYWLPSAGVLLFHDSDAEILGYTDPLGGGLIVLDPDIKDLYFVEPIGSELALGIRRRSGQKPREILRVPADLSQPPQTVYSQDAGEKFRHPVSRADGWLAFFGESDLGARRLHRVHLPSAQHQLFPWQAGNIAPVMGLSPRADLHFSIGIGSEPARFVAWPFGGTPHALPVRSGPGHVLPGR